MRDSPSGPSSKVSVPRRYRPVRAPVPAGQAGSDRPSRHRSGSRRSAAGRFRRGGHVAVFGRHVHGVVGDRQIRGAGAAQGAGAADHEDADPEPGHGVQHRTGGGDQELLVGRKVRTVRTTASTAAPASDSATAATSFTSTATGVTPGSSLAGFRDNASTRCPRRLASATTLQPTIPVAPSTATVMRCVIERLLLRRVFFRAAGPSCAATNAVSASAKPRACGGLRDSPCAIPMTVATSGDSSTRGADAATVSLPIPRNHSAYAISPPMLPSHR